TVLELRAGPQPAFIETCHETPDKGRSDLGSIQKIIRFFSTLEVRMFQPAPSITVGPESTRVSRWEERDRQPRLLPVGFFAKKPGRMASLIVTIRTTRATGLLDFEIAEEDQSRSIQDRSANLVRTSSRTKASGTAASCVGRSAGSQADRTASISR